MCEHVLVIRAVVHDMYEIDPRVPRLCTHRGKKNTHTQKQGRTVEDAKNACINCNSPTRNDVNITNIRVSA